ncbi:hypothetical protein [Staphylococcus delphini]|nr:hypothetical protein [Staphylococcus delphini]MDE9798546.1 hypothetical protein [Staphylococcus delphini]MDE9805385.1 hypothetical protein [Staphylococcus delphini]
MAKMRGLKRKFDAALRGYKKHIAYYDGYTELYVPQITIKES